MSELRIAEANISIKISNNFVVVTDNNKPYDVCRFRVKTGETLADYADIISLFISNYLAEHYNA